MVRMTLEGLELRHFQALRAVAAEGTFGRAARALGYTQSAVSQQIASLERIVGEAMFDRPGGPKPVRLTAAGRMMLAHAEEILERVHMVERDLDAFMSGERGRIDVGVFQSVSVKVLPAIVGRLLSESPDIDVRPVLHDNDARSVARVVAGDLDLTFVGGPVSESSVDVIELVDDPFVAVMHPDRAPADDIDVEFLRSGPLVAQPATDGCQTKIDAGLTDIGVAPDYVFRTGDNAALQSMVRAGMGTAIMPLLAVDPHDPGVQVRRIDQLIPPRTIGVAVGPHPSPAVMRFVEIAREVCTTAVAAV
jgi:DNA-binding transcriptional LysR family regulator